ncbi:MAG: hypothetical protein M1303_04010 [Bacteroidetes bacterium]|nr:hypothetical protein [Bacteroidota bacterium]
MRGRVQSLNAGESALSLPIEGSVIVPVVLVAAIVLLSSRFLGQIPDALTNCLVIAGVFVLTFLSLPRGVTNSLFRNYGVRAAIFILFWLLYLIMPSNIYFLRIFLISIVCMSLGKSLGNNEKHLAVFYWALALTTFSFAVLLTWFFSEPLLWFGVQRFSEDASSLVGSLTRQQALFNASASGIFISMMFTLFGLFITLLSRGDGKRWRLFLVYATEIIFANLIFMAILQPLYGWLQAVVSIPRFHIMDLPVFLFLLDMIPLIFFLRQVTLTPGSLKIFPLRLKQIMAVAVFSIGMLLMVYHEQSAIN